MSRLRRLKELRRKNRIKATACGLALALAIGSAQGLGTYALFTDTEDVSSDLAISTGDVDVEVSKGHSFTDVQPNSRNPYIYTITNNGTLRQQLKLNIDIPTTVTDDETLNSALEYLKSNISYSVDFGMKQPTEEGAEAIPVPDNEVGEKVDNIGNIKLSEEKILKNKSDKNIFVLEPGQQITVNATINIPNMEKDIQDALNNIGDIGLNVKVEARQISDNINQITDYVFYDEAIQENTISVVQKEVITIATGEYAHYININGNNYKSLFIPINVNGMTDENQDDIKISATVETVKNHGKYYYKANYVDKGEFKYIKITPSEGEYIAFQDILNITINIQVGEEDPYSLLCWVIQESAGNSNCEKHTHNHPQGEYQHRCQTQKVYDGYYTLSTLEEPMIPEEIEQSKEEITEIPRQPEVIEPPKENKEIEE